MLTRADIASLNKARATVQKLESGLEMAGEQAYSGGRLAEACRSADHALMNLLVIANVQGQGVTDEDLFGEPLTPPKRQR
jgi:hypothetical protein